MVERTSYEAPHYAVFSSLPPANFLPLTSKYSSQHQDTLELELLSPLETYGSANTRVTYVTILNSKTQCKFMNCKSKHKLQGFGWEARR